MRSFVLKTSDRSNIPTIECVTVRQRFISILLLQQLNRSPDSRKMPCLNISTNVNLDGADTSAILSEATSTVAKIIGKPETYVMVVLKGSVPMAFGGTEEATAYGELVSIGGLNSDINKKLSAAISNILETKRNVPKSRFYLKFYDTKAHQSQEYAQCLHALHQF